MNWRNRNLTPRSMVMLHFGCFALFWGGVAATEIAGGGPATSLRAANSVPAGLSDVIGVMALALHAAVVVALAWKAHRWFFSHGHVAVVFCGVPLVPLVANVWFVPAFLYVIADLHVGLASRHETLGKLQSGQRHLAESGRA